MRERRNHSAICPENLKREPYKGRTTAAEQASSERGAPLRGPAMARRKIGRKDQEGGGKNFPFQLSTIPEGGRPRRTRASKTTNTQKRGGKEGKKGKAGAGYSRIGGKKWGTA